MYKELIVVVVVVEFDGFTANDLSLEVMPLAFVTVTE